MQYYNILILTLHPDSLLTNQCHDKLELIPVIIDPDNIHFKFRIYIDN